MLEYNCIQAAVFYQTKEKRRKRRQKYIFIGVVLLCCYLLVSVGVVLGIVFGVLNKSALTSNVAYSTVYVSPKTSTQLNTHATVISSITSTHLITTTTESISTQTSTATNKIVQTTQTESTSTYFSSTFNPSLTNSTLILTTLTSTILFTSTTARLDTTISATFFTSTSTSSLALTTLTSLTNTFISTESLSSSVSSTNTDVTSISTSQTTSTTITDTSSSTLSSTLAQSSTSSPSTLTTTPLTCASITSLPVDCGKPSNQPTISNFNFKRIISGEQAASNSWPWMVSLRNSANLNQQICAGALISTCHVLTAAHCIASLTPSKLLVLAGINNANSFTSENVYYPSGFSIIPGFNVNLALGNNVALIKLSTPVVISSNISVICLPASIDDQLDVIGQKIVVAGWGIVNKTSLQRASELEQTVLNVFDKNALLACSNANYNYTNIYCAMDANVTRVSNVCNGDGGGPMMYYKASRWYVYGISSYVYLNSQSLCDNTRPSFFTNVPFHLQWILNSL